ncbi:MAG: sel1 repeat family protein [Candidatus Thiothrix singaporensis]|uniref:Sel1 repeat family protein n=1 Tax=Candidatus Thiothrix singaporensis TaxID=2799669 RepID=A0A7L6AUB3_9GAMM|nr:MAG: sel1 repeat family protein [Candidatus Thiothrix singaporensis]
MKFKILLIITIGIMLYACSGNGSPVRDYKFNAQDINQVKNAANQGDAGAMYELGMAYLGTTGMVDEDYKQGLSWLTKSAEKGDSLAQSTLGGFYLSEKCR